MSREFKSRDVEELIKQAFRLAPENFFRDSIECKSDIDHAIDFVRMAADEQKCEVVRIEERPPASSLYTHLLGVVVAETIKNFPVTPVSEIIQRAEAEIKSAGIRP